MFPAALRRKCTYVAGLHQDEALADKTGIPTCSGNAVPERPGHLGFVLGLQTRREGCKRIQSGLQDGPERAPAPGMLNGRQNAGSTGHFFRNTWGPSCTKKDVCGVCPRRCTKTIGNIAMDGPGGLGPMRPRPRALLTAIVAPGMGGGANI